MCSTCAGLVPALLLILSIPPDVSAADEAQALGRALDENGVPVAFVSVTFGSASSGQVTTAGNYFESSNSRIGVGRCSPTS